MNLCEFCKEEHDPGSTEWRDCQQQQYEHFVNHPDDWKFEVTVDQVERVTRAHLTYTTEFNGVPDLAAIRMLVGHQFSQPTTGDEGGPGMDVKALKSFWDKFSGDMPDYVQRQVGPLNPLDALWNDKKLAKILRDYAMAYMDWNTEEFTSVLKSPAHLRAAADFLEKWEKEGYALYHFEVADDTASYYVRKGAMVGKMKEKQ